MSRMNKYCCWFECESPNTQASVKIVSVSEPSPNGLQFGSTMILMMFQSCRFTIFPRFIQTLSGTHSKSHRFELPIRSRKWCKPWLHGPPRIRFRYGLIPGPVGPHGPPILGFPKHETKNLKWGVLLISLTRRVQCRHRWLRAMHIFGQINFQKYKF